MVRFVGLVLWGLLSLGILRGAEEESAKRVFRVLGYGEGRFEGICYDPGGRSAVLELAFSPHEKSRSYVLPESGERIGFFVQEARRDGSIRRVEVASCVVDSGVEAALLVFLGGPEGYRVLVMDESAEAFGGGAIRFFNLSGVPLRVSLGGEVFELGDEAVRTAVSREGESVAANLKIWVSRGGRESLVFSSRIRSEARYPKLLVLKPPLDDGGRVLRIDTLW